MSPDERWMANKKFLERAIQRGDEILLSTPVNRVRPGSAFERELQYMIGEKGFKVSSDGAKLVRKGENSP